VHLEFLAIERILGQIRHLHDPLSELPALQEAPRVGGLLGGGELYDDLLG